MCVHIQPYLKGSTKCGGKSKNGKCTRVSWYSGLSLHVIRRTKKSKCGEGEERKSWSSRKNVGKMKQDQSKQIIGVGCKRQLIHVVITKGSLEDIGAGENKRNCMGMDVDVGEGEGESTM